MLFYKKVLTKNFFDFIEKMWFYNNNNSCEHEKFNSLHRLLLLTNIQILRIRFYTYIIVC